MYHDEEYCSSIVDIVTADFDTVIWPEVDDARPSGFWNPPFSDPSELPFRLVRLLTPNFAWWTNPKLLRLVGLVASGDQSRGMLWMEPDVFSGGGPVSTWTSGMTPTPCSE